MALLMSLTLAMRILSPLTLSWLSRHIDGETRLLVICALISLISFGGFLGVTSFWGLFACMALMAFFWSVSLPVVEAMTLRSLAGRTQDYSRIRLWGSVGFIVAVVGTGLLLDSAPVNALLWVNLSILAGGLFASWQLNQVLAPMKSVESSPVPVAVVADNRRALLAVFLVAGMLMAAAHAPLYVFYSLHLVQHGFEKQVVGLLWSLGVVAEIMVFLWIPRWLSAVPVSMVLNVSLALAVLRFLLIAWCADYPLVLIGAQILHGATFGAFLAAAMAALHQWFPNSQQTKMQALYGSLSVGLGGLLGNLISGFVWENWGPEITFSTGSLFAAIALVGSILAYSLINRNK